MTAYLGFPSVGGLDAVPHALTPLAAEDYATDQEVRWCPGCGDYGVLTAVRELLPSLGMRRENTVFISGIGCSSRFPYYMNTYGIHSIHGRAPAIATGLATTRPDLSVWVITGDGDALSIGGNHLIHALRRNVNLNILLFNNRIYGLTKGQYSPTSELGKVTKSSPMGSIDHPFDPLSLALGAEATFVGRAFDLDRPGLTAVLSAAVAHRGAALVEILQDCPVFNAGAFDAFRKKSSRDAALIRLTDREPIRFGSPTADGLGMHGLSWQGSTLTVADWGSLPTERFVVHDRADLVQAFALARFSESDPSRAVAGVLYSVPRTTYDDAVREQTEQAVAAATRPDLQSLLRGRESWTVATGSEPGR
jgi:2-oxoglutarate ferredoxin oxidoreductase subunit beta